MTTGERPEGWPRPGNSDELHEWARETDAANEQAIKERLKASEAQLRDFVLGLAGPEGLSHEQEVDLALHMAGLEDTVAAHLMYVRSPKLADMYDGQPMNS
jgi:hypothetical protein